MRVALSCPMRLRRRRRLLRLGRHGGRGLRRRAPLDVSRADGCRVGDGRGDRRRDGLRRHVEWRVPIRRSRIDLAVVRPERPMDLPGRRPFRSECRVRPRERRLQRDRGSLRYPGRRRDVDEHPVERQLRSRRSGRSVDRVCRTGRRRDREVGGLRIELECVLERIRRPIHHGDRVRLAGDLREHVRRLLQEPGRRRHLDSRPIVGLRHLRRVGCVVRERRRRLLPDLGLGADVGLQQPSRQSLPHR